MVKGLSEENYRRGKRRKKKVGEMSGKGKKR